MLVKYVGRRVEQIDTMYRTATVWCGHGDVQTVPDDKARKMVAFHPDMYQEVQPEMKFPKVLPPQLESDPTVLEQTMVTEVTGETVRLVDASRTALAKYAREKFGIRVLDGHGKGDILTVIANIEEVAAGYETLPRGAEAEPAGAEQAAVAPAGGAARPAGLGSALMRKPAKPIAQGIVAPAETNNPF